ncbi:MAG: DNA polymerase IV [Candidatus Komeilibacteria bacterium]|nr:DNA polymerase IV [Candidatus Komeilibacteria bacterium]
MPFQKQKRNLIIRSWPQAILHLDADAFFASCEQSLHPEYRGKPVITGAERGIVSAASYEAKALGIQRGVPLWEVKKICPQAIILASDYESYSLISKRMFDIMRRFTPTVEEYSIDEGFADLTGLRRPLHSSYEGIARQMKDAIERELDITVSVGVSLSKSLAKLAANLNKPSGLTMVPGRQIEDLLHQMPLPEVWGFGKATVSYLQKFGLKTAYDFAAHSEQWINEHLDKPGREIWRELRGEVVYQINTEGHTDYQSISKVKTFTPPSADKQYLWAQLARNLESACIKARRYHLAPTKVLIYLREHNFISHGREISLSRASNSPLLILPLLADVFSKLYKSDKLYRCTGVVLVGLQPDEKTQESLFGDCLKIDKLTRATGAIDTINGKFGKHTIHQCSSLMINKAGRGDREKKSTRWQQTLRGEDYRRHLNIPRWTV